MDTVSLDERPSRLSIFRYLIPSNIGFRVQRVFSAPDHEGRRVAA